MSSEYKEIIGEKLFLDRIKLEIEMSKNMLIKIDNRNVIKIIKGFDLLNNDEAILNTIIKIVCLYPDIKNVIIEDEVISEELLNLGISDRDHGMGLFYKWKFKIAIIAEDEMNLTDAKDLKICSSIQQAIKYFNA
jgi:hypothetical protein